MALLTLVLAVLLVGYGTGHMLRYAHPRWTWPALFEGLEVLTFIAVGLILLILGCFNMMEIPK